jgi:hypothetical protein
VDRRNALALPAAGGHAHPGHDRRARLARQCSHAAPLRGSDPERAKRLDLAIFGGIANRFMNLTKKSAGSKRCPFASRFQLSQAQVAQRRHGTSATGIEDGVDVCDTLSHRRRCSFWV